MKKEKMISYNQLTMQGRRPAYVNSVQKILTITLHINLIACPHEGTFIRHHTNESKHQHEEEDESKDIEQKQ
jgi:hypothetical protein